MALINQLLCVNEKVKQEIRKKYNIKDEDILSNAKVIREWLAKNSHLPIEQSKERLENFMIHNKMSIERTKKGMESYYTARTVLSSDFFEKLTPKSMGYQKAKGYTCVVAMPELLDNYSRISIHKLTNTDSEIYDPLESLIIMAMIKELRFCKDCSYSDVIIIDMSGYSLKHIVKFTPNVIKKLRYILIKALTFKINNIHLIHVPQYTDKILPIFRSIVPSKVYKKLHLHTSLENLYKFVPKKYLPSDYGGEKKSLIDLFAKWCDVLEMEAPFFEHHLLMKTDESLRIGKCHEFEIFGTGSQGSFKKLNIEA